MMICDDGNVPKPYPPTHVSSTLTTCQIICSRLYNVYRPEELKTIFNFVLAILESGINYMDEEVGSRKEELDIEMGTGNLLGEINGDLE